VTRRLDEWRNDQWSVTLESLDPEDQSLWRMTKRGDKFLLRLPLVIPEDHSLTGSKPKPLPSLETQFQPVTDPSAPAVIEMVDVALRSCFLTPASEPKLTNPDEVHEAIGGLKVGKAPGPNCISNRALEHLPQRALSLLTQIFNAVLLTHQFPSVEARSSDLYPETREGSGTALILSAH